MVDVFKHIRDNRGLFLVFWTVAAILMYFGYKAIPTMSAGGIYYPPVDWLTVNIFFFLIFGFIVLYFFNGFRRQGDSHMRQNWTETRWFKDMYTCPKCGGNNVKFAFQDPRERMMFARCETCGHEWIFNLPPARPV